MALNVDFMQQEKVQALLSRAQFMETPLTGATLQVSCVSIASAPKSSMLQEAL